MRDYGCELFHTASNAENGKYVPNYNTACFRGLATLRFRQDVLEKDIVYIDQYTYPLTEKYIPLIISLVNKITPCSIVDGYIRVQLLSTYDQSLIVLNFIRNLWNQPWSFKNYNEEFFRALAKGRRKDPIARLTAANKVACTNVKATYIGHSNCFAGNTLKIKTTEELLKFKGTEIQTFLTKE